MPAPKPITAAERRSLHEANALLNRAREIALDANKRGVAAAIFLAIRELRPVLLDADRRPLTPENQAEADGYDVHHDMHGWFVVEPGEDDPADGYSIGFDGRDHFASEADAWCRAAQMARGAA